MLFRIQVRRNPAETNRGSASRTNSTKKRKRARGDPVLRAEASDEVYGVICAAGLLFMLEFARHQGLRTFGDLGSGVGNLVAIAALAGFDVVGVEMNQGYFDFQARLFKKLSLSDSSLKCGDMFEWRPPVLPLVVWVNNEKLQKTHDSWN